MLAPARRTHYPPLVLMLADAAIERLRSELAGAAPGLPECLQPPPLQVGPS
jgi:hypothetical protein